MKITRKPEWLQKRINPAAHADMERMLGELKLHTVCQEASCPNISECFRQRQATFLILGRACTRLCSFCNVVKQTPLPVDPQEPDRVAEAVVRLGLSHVVITSPTRDDLPDGGAGLYSATTAAIRAASPSTKIELLVPDFMGRRESLATVMGLHHPASISDGGHGGEELATEAYQGVRRGADDAANTGIRSKAVPDIVGHNLETVPRLYHIRSGADYRRSLEVLKTLHDLDPSLRTKSGVMVGLGETDVELFSLFADLRQAGCTFLSIGQYLAPSRKHFPVQAFIEPGRFDLYRQKALELGFDHVESGPYVRSSYHAAGYGL
jgi:lipoic acid synthetase